MTERITTIGELAALPENAVVVTEIEDAKTGTVFVEAFQKDDEGHWWSTHQGDYADHTRPSGVLRPWGAGATDIIRALLVYTPGDRP